MSAAPSPSPSLRHEHAEQTRARILDALVELLAATGAEEVSVPEVARRSGVSLRTIYRYYPTRDDLLDGAGDWIFRQKFGDVPLERTLGDLPAVFAAAAEQWEAHRELARAMAYSPSGKELLRKRRERRFEDITRAVARAAPNLSSADHRLDAAVLGYLQSIRTWVTLRQDVGLGRDETVAAVVAALQTLIDDVRRRDRAAGRTERGRTG
jgi:AcrR family transcriptional regulator